MPSSPLTPVTVLTGFLGSGKTTLLNRLLAHPDLRDSAVLINEFGAESIDHHLVRSSSENIAVLNNGCVCCSVAGDMVKALRELYFQRAAGAIPAFERVVIETTGLADPAPILTSLIDLPLAAARFALSGVVCVVDAEHGSAHLDTHLESLRQVAMADRLLLSKIDRAAPDAVAALTERLAAINPRAPILDAAEADPAALIDLGLYRTSGHGAGGNAPDIAAWLGTGTAPGGLFERKRLTHRDARIDSFVLRYPAPLDLDRLTDALEALCEIAGPRLLRLKGLAFPPGEAAPRAVHAVYHTLYPMATLAPVCGEDRCSRLVFITLDFPRQEVTTLLTAFLGPADA